ncbi:MAG: CvpA family protein [Pseudomonadota bacterium]
MSALTTPDLALLVIVFMSAVMGLFRGLVRETLSLLTWLVAFFVGMYLSPRLAEGYADTFGGFSVARAVFFVVIFFAVLVLSSVVQWLLGKLIESTGLSSTDRLLGFLFGAGRGVIVCIVALIALRGFVEDSSWWQNSRLIPEFMAFEETVLDLMGYAKDAVLDLNERLDNAPSP